MTKKAATTAIVHYTRKGYNGDLTYTALCGETVKGNNVTVTPEKVNCKKCAAHVKYKDDLGHSMGIIKTTIKRRIFLESDILKADEFSSALRRVRCLIEDKGLEYTDRVFSEVLDYAWHDLAKTWEAVKKADEIYAVSSLLPLSGGSYVGAPVIFNGMCERAIKEGVTGKSVYILTPLSDVDWYMIDLDLMKEAFKNNHLYMYDDDYDKLIKVDVTKIEK